MATEPALAGRPVAVLPDDLPLVEIDAVLIERVLGNLLENAAKYTPAGSRIEIGAAVDGDRSWCVSRTMVRAAAGAGGSHLPRSSNGAKGERHARRRPRAGHLPRHRRRPTAAAIHAENAPSGGARFVFTLPRGMPPTGESSRKPRREHERHGERAPHSRRRG